MITRKIKRCLTWTFIVYVVVFIVTLWSTYLDNSGGIEIHEKENIDTFGEPDNDVKEGKFDILRDNEEVLDSGIRENKRDYEDVQKQAVNLNMVKNIGVLKSNDSEREYDRPGELGKAVVLDNGTLTPYEKQRIAEGWQVHAFNKYVSDLISVHRTLPDVRDPGCKTIQYGEIHLSACVIIIFHNEAWSVLLRTVYSVLSRSEPELLKQVILVDDASNLDHLKEPLQEFADGMEQVTLVRAKERTGLIRARLIGFDACKADVAVFLDSHCEATTGWLVPLLSRIQENWTHVVTPVIDSIKDDTFEYSMNRAHPQVGGFTWDLQFSWHFVSTTEIEREHYKPFSLLKSPTMAGGLFAISSSFFKHLGKYDSGFDIWGGENLELSFKTWMCGGTLEIVQCSCVGHVFRKRSPFQKDIRHSVLKRNLVRLAEVWLDDFKEYYYRRINFDLGYYGDLTERKALRESLHCHDFQWYLDNVYPDLFVPNQAIAFGEIRNEAQPMCVDGRFDKAKDPPLSAYRCHGQAGNQYWLLSPANEMRRDDICWDLVNGSEIKLRGCHGSHGHQEFLYREDGTIYNPTHKKCLTLNRPANGIEIQECTGNRRQKWRMERANGRD